MKKYWIWDNTTIDGKKGFETRSECLKYCMKYLLKGEIVTIYDSESMKHEMGRIHCVDQEKYYFYGIVKVGKKSTGPHLIGKDGKVKLI